MGKGQLSRENGLNPSLITKWEGEFRKNPENAISGHGKISKEDVRIGEFERVIGQLCAENAFLKKVLSNLEMKNQEQRGKTARG